jgi:hypothetical protein
MSRMPQTLIERHRTGLLKPSLPPTGQFRILDMARLDPPFGTPEHCIQVAPGKCL